MIEKEEYTGQIINACMEVHNELGNGFLETVYQEALEEEFKFVGSLTKPHKAQVLNYLNAANKEIGLLVNFGETSLKWERITNFKNQENR